MNKVAAILATCLLAVPAAGQVRVTGVMQLSMPAGGEWSQPRFSPDGASVFVTGADYRGIWQYSLKTGDLRELTRAPGAGYGFSVSGDGTQIAYRSTAWDRKNRTRVQEIAVCDLRSAVSTIVRAGSDLSTPVFAHSSLLFVDRKKPVSLPRLENMRPVVLGIEEQKIALQRGNVRELLDPMGQGSYIWPSLSPDGTKLVAVEMGRGGFICDLEGNVLVRLGKCNAPAWTRDGEWIVFMDDRDDGHQVISSDLCCVSSDGARRVQLTFTPDRVEMYPDCSPHEDVILCNTLGGEVLLLRYEEDAQ